MGCVRETPPIKNEAITGCGRETPEIKKKTEKKNRIQRGMCKRNSPDNK